MTRSGNPAVMLGELERLVTGRERSLFRRDVEANRAALENVLGRSRIAVIGAAGSIGSAVAKKIVDFRPRALALFDLNENSLVELVRDLRSTDGLAVPPDFAALPIGLGSAELLRYFSESPPFDFVLNLCALKHVRSEKDVYSLLRMIDTNVLFPHDFLEALPYTPRKFFSVSSDKATNPANLMGATKMVMEDVLLLHSTRQTVSSSRFANVAFSDGSLPYAFLRRIEKRQAIAAPNDVKRYFISHEEAGELCLLCAGLGENRDVFFPKLTADLNEETFANIAEKLLAKLGYEAVACATEDEAKRRAAALIPEGKWPCYFFASDTTGEKEREEFYSQEDRLDVDRFREIGVIKRSLEAGHAERVDAFLSFARRAKTVERVTKAEIVEALRLAVPTLAHVEKGKSLDEKM